MTTNTDQEPVVHIQVGDSRITLLGTAHVSRASAEKVRALLATDEYDAAAVELCPSRYNALLDPDSLARMDLIRVIREGKVTMVMASLALGAYQQRMAEQFGIEPGAEQRAAIDAARETHRPVLLIDREIGTTLRRVAHSVPWWKRFVLFSGLLASLISNDEVSEEEIERLKEGDILETTFAQFAAEQKDLYGPLIDERDQYMAARLLEEVRTQGHENVLAVVGAGHLKGLQRCLEQGMADPAERIRSLDANPPPARWPKLIPWLLLVLILGGFAIGFARSPELGWQMVADWTLITGGLAALGTLVAAGHPLSVLAALLSAPFTTLHPAIGVGMVTAASEIWLRKPEVGDFARLRKDVTHWRGWWRNRVARTLLVFFFSNLGAASGTYVAGFRIFGRLAG